MRDMEEKKKKQQGYALNEKTKDADGQRWAGRADRVGAFETAEGGAEQPPRQLSGRQGRYAELEEETAARRCCCGVCSPWTSSCIEKFYVRGRRGSSRAPPPTPSDSCGCTTPSTNSLFYGQHPRPAPISSLLDFSLVPLCRHLTLIAPPVRHRLVTLHFDARGDDGRAMGVRCQMQTPARRLPVTADPATKITLSTLLIRTQQHSRGMIPRYSELDEQGSHSFHLTKKPRTSPTIELDDKAELDRNTISVYTLARSRMSLPSSPKGNVESDGDSLSSCTLVGKDSPPSPPNNEFESDAAAVSGRRD